MEGLLRASSREWIEAKYSCSVSTRFPEVLRPGGYLPLPVVGTTVDVSGTTVSKRGAHRFWESGW